MSLGIGHIILLPFDERLNINGWDEAHITPRLLECPASAMRRRTSLHGDQALGLLCHDREQLPP